MNIAICDDETYVRSYLRKLTELYEPDCRITEFSSGEALLKHLEQELPDILFLDISMKETDGMEVARKVRNRTEEKGKGILGSLPLLIFVTGYPEYAMEAFSVHAFWFLVKPIKEPEFAAVLEKAVREYHCLSDRKGESSGELLVRTGTTTRKVLTEDIYYAESSNRKVILCLAQEKIIFYGKISRLEEELPNQFFRIHKGYLINMKYVERYSRTEVRMKNGDTLLISKYKYQEFVKAYLNYIAEEYH